MLMCERCGEAYEDDTSYDYCTCGGSLMEAKECEDCGEAMPADRHRICEECLKKEITYDNILLYGDQEKEEIKINMLFWYAFGEDKINEILKEKFEQLPEEYKKQCLKEVVDCDEYYFIEWLKKGV